LLRSYLPTTFSWEREQWRQTTYGENSSHLRIFAPELKKRLVTWRSYLHAELQAKSVRHSLERPGKKIETPPRHLFPISLEAYSPKISLGASRNPEPRRHRIRGGLATETRSYVLESELRQQQCYARF
jgi:hypothetical protein